MEDQNGVDDRAADRQHEGANHAAGQRSILELRGLGKETWQGIDAAEYVRQERASWERHEVPQPLPREFYDRPAIIVAREMLGMVLVWNGPQGRQAGRIVETEAYDGPEDAASHARSGPKGRAAVMFGAAGYAYVYLIYGIHHCLNVSTGPEGYPAAVLIRALEPLEGIAGGTNGPGRLCKTLGLDRSHNGLDMTGERLFIEDRGLSVREKDVVAKARIGIQFAGEPWISQPWRLYERGNRWVSKK